MSERTDTERLDFLAEQLNGAKWADVLPMFRPRDVLGENTEKYIKFMTFRDAIDYAIRHGTNPNY